MVEVRDFEPGLQLVLVEARRAIVPIVLGAKSEAENLREHPAEPLLADVIVRLVEPVDFVQVDCDASQPWA